MPAIATPHPRPAPAPLDRRLLAITRRGAGESRADRPADGMWGLRLPLPYPQTRSVNAFLLETGDGALLVDCGTSVGAGWEGLEHALALAGTESGKIAMLLCTHLHSDHAGLADAVIERTGCRFVRGAGPSVAIDRLREPTVPRAERRAAALRAGVPERDLPLMIDELVASPGVGRRPPADALLGEGDVVATRTGTWEVLPATGHSCNQIALYERRRRWLIAADVAYPSARPYIEYGHTPDPLAEHLATLDRLAALPVDLLFAGHGAPDPAPAARFAGARDATLAWVSAVRRVLPPGGDTAYGITCALHGDDPNPDRRQSALSVVLAVLRHLELRGEVARVPAGAVDHHVPRRT